MSILKRLFQGNKSPLYDRYLLVGDSKIQIIWEKDSWKIIEPLLSQLYEQLPSTPRVVANLVDDSLKYPVHNKKLIWSEVNNQRWTLERERLGDIKFVNIQIEGPSSLYCEKHGIWQDLFIEIIRPYSEYHSQAIHIAVGPKFQGDPQINKLIERLSTLIKPVFKAKTHSHWIEKKSRSKYIDAFMTIGFNYFNAHKDKVPDIDKIDGQWESLDH